jgi:hypothetical protein
MAGLGEVATDVEVDGLMNSVDGDQKISCKLFFLCGRVPREEQ